MRLKHELIKKLTSSSREAAIELEKRKLAE
jgi:hypothetical protein